ncbi:choice-of-anchor J domain-containing protein [uncultured Winogradskyella sp.]|uniref:choice-of-anchor J domain-containing protein n=1 Tax=uncultured Winogradskyella sp. TaxID=395353 RepID=UPI00261EC890|nr:choice-of-anchor J domain-containing protein [uncultured Winogradskyella sp.]
MKKIVYLFALVAIAFTSCNPLEDINEEIDAIPAAPNVGTFEYTLTTEDYDALMVDGAFQTVDEAKALLPDFLADLYPLYGQGSSVLVNYNLFFSGIDGVSDFTDSDTYQLSNADYASTGSDAFGFYPNVDATDEIPAVLDAQIMSPVDGQYLLVEYDQYFETPTVGIADLYRAEFPGDFGNFEVVSISGPADLGWNATGSNVTGSAFNGSSNAMEEWMVSPLIDLSGQTSVLFEITQEIDFFGADPASIDIMISTTYTPGGGIDAMDWTALSFDKNAYGSLTTSPDLDFSAYDGQEVYVAFRYTATDSNSARWRVQSFATKAVGVSGDTNGKGEYFVYDGGSWEEAEGVYYLSDADYDSMGEESGQPGRFNNFSDSVLPENYVPQFLGLTYPFAQEGDELFVIYKYFSGGVSRRGDFYTFTSGEWLPFQASLQFGFNDGVWVPDNTIRYELVTADYELVVSELTGVMGFEDAVDNLDSFGNFKRTGSSDSWTDEMMLTAVGAILDNLNPSAEEGQKYVVIAETWAPGNATEEFAVIKTGGEWVYQ